MPIVVTGATGQLGRLTVEALLRRGVPAVDIIATGRDIARIKDLADRGITVRRADFADILQNGAVVGATGEGRISAASRADYAEAAAVVLTTEGHTGAVYELGGDEAFTLTEPATAISAVAGKQVTHADLPVTDFARALATAGLPAELAEVLADADRGMSHGEMYTDSGDLHRLIGRPPTTLTEALAGALRH